MKSWAKMINGPEGLLRETNPEKDTTGIPGTDQCQSFLFHVTAGSSSISKVIKV